MSWSLQLVNGDLFLQGGSLSTVTGSAKLVQDLSCWLLQPLGANSLHTSYGSILEYGVDENGNYYPGLIGSPNNATSIAQIEAEIKRVCSSYQTQQINRNNSDVQIYGASTLTLGEALLGVNNISASSQNDIENIEVTLETGSGAIVIDLPVNASTPSVSSNPSVPTS
jgi:hypothetical protein